MGSCRTIYLLFFSVTPWLRSAKVLSRLKPSCPAADDIFVEASEPISNVLYMARQPILDAGERIAGYELLYRAAAESSAIFSDINAASHSVLEQIVILGCRELSGGKRLY